MLVAVVIAETPGTGNILRFFLIHSLKRTKPGSDKIGVPASEIKAIFSPLAIELITNGNNFFSLNL